jgi:hypothetical protein
MWKITTNLLRVVGAMVAFGLLFMVLVAATSGETNAQQQRSNFATLINELSGKDVTVLIEFVSPVAGQTAWFVPEDLSVDNQFAGKRLMGTTGDDFICIDEIGVGLQNTFCIPLSNIASISFNPPANSS